jgi:HK97 gp10 family phage protein
MTFTEIDRIIANLERADAIIAKFSDLILAEMQRLVPVKTGALKRSIAAHLEGMVAEITAGEGLTYAAHVEYGTSSAAAHPFFRVAVERYADAFRAEVQQLLG